MKVVGWIKSGSAEKWENDIKSNECWDIWSSSYNGDISKHQI